MSSNRSQQPTDRGGWLGFIIGPAFFLVALWLFAGPVRTEVPQAKATPPPPGAIHSNARREIIGDPPKILINGFERTCVDCHKLFQAGGTTPGDRLQHEHVVLDHGINDQCNNCHDLKNMDRLVLYTGESIPYSDVPQLCQKCHGPVFKDWERGIHGRVNDHWNPDFGPPRKLKCIQCHNPHEPRKPAMDPLKPLPGPNTLRMGDPHQHTPHAAELAEGDPLRRVLMHAEDTANDEREGTSHTSHDEGSVH